MKLLALTAQYGSRSKVQIAWRHDFYFSGAEPDYNRLITLDLPGLDKPEPANITRWLSAQSNDTAALGSKSRRELVEFSPEHWTYTVLEDYLDAQNYMNFYWHVSQHFTLEEIKAFEEKHMPRAWEAAETVTAGPDDYTERDLQLANIESLFHRTHSVAYGGMNRIGVERTKAQEAADEARVAAFHAEGEHTIDEWATFVHGINSYLIRYNQTQRLGQRIADETHDARELLQILEELRKKHYKLTEAIAGYPQFWTAIAPWLSFPANVHGESIDVSNAYEVVVPLHFGLLDAKRIGVIVPGRRAMCIPAAKRGGKPTYIRADRRLAFEVLERGGSMKKHGCTLTADVDGTSIRPLLTQVEELIVLANLSPEGALKKLDGLDIADDHLVFDAAKRARGDHRWARIFADLLIELHTGLDADVARRLVG